MKQLRIIESKVYASTIGAGAGGILAAFVLWLLGVLLWHASSTASAAENAVAAVPAPVSGVVVLLITLLGTFLAGYFAPHTPRPDLSSGAASVSVTPGPKYDPAALSFKVADATRAAQVSTSASPVSALADLAEPPSSTEVVAPTEPAP